MMVNQVKVGAQKELMLKTGLKNSTPWIEFHHIISSQFITTDPNIQLQN